VNGCAKRISGLSATPILPDADFFHSPDAPEPEGWHVPERSEGRVSLAPLGSPSPVRTPLGPVTARQPSRTAAGRRRRLRNALGGHAGRCLATAPEQSGEVLQYPWIEPLVIGCIRRRQHRVVPKTDEFTTMTTGRVRQPAHVLQRGLFIEVHVVRVRQRAIHQGPLRYDERQRRYLHILPAFWTGLPL